MKNLFVQEQNLAWEYWSDEAVNAISPIRWKTLITADRVDSSAMTLGVTEIPVGSIELKHHHPEPEVYYFIAGKGRVIIDAVTYDVQPGSSLFIPGNADHEVINDGDVPLKLVWVFPIDKWDEGAYTFGGMV